MCLLLCGLLPCLHRKDNKTLKLDFNKHLILRAQHQNMSRVRGKIMLLYYWAIFFLSSTELYSSLMNFHEIDVKLHCYNEV
jgi:hypothetical protein